MRPGMPTAFPSNRQPGCFFGNQQIWMSKNNRPWRQSEPAKKNWKRPINLFKLFRSMVRQRQGDCLDGWLSAVAKSHLAELQTFAFGIERDKAAVQAGLTLPYSNGLLEGHTNRLKLIKRSMYGRAKFDLLRQRVLCAS